MDNKAPEAFRTISEVADELDVPQHVLRFWETRFHEIRPMKRGGGRRYYRPDDVDLLRGIRHLLYGEGYTIRGVQRILSEEGQKFVQAVWQSGASQPPHRGDASDEDEVDDLLPDETPEQPEGLRGRLASLVGRDLNEPAVDQRREPPMHSAPVPRIDPPVRAGLVAPQVAAPVYPQVPQQVVPSVATPRVAVEPQVSAPVIPPQVFVPPPVAVPEPSLYAPRHDVRKESLPREDLRKLQAALHELAECRKLLNAVSPA